MSADATRILIPETTLYEDLGGEAVLLNLKTGTYYSLDEVGSRMWSALARFGAEDQAVAALTPEYDVDEARLRADFRDLVRRLEAQGLVRLEEGTSPDSGT